MRKNPSKKLFGESANGEAEISEIDMNDVDDYEIMSLSMETNHSVVDMSLALTPRSPLVNESSSSSSSSFSSSEADSIVNISVTLASGVFTPVPAVYATPRTPGESIQSFQERVTTFSESFGNSSGPLSPGLPPTPRTPAFETVTPFGHNTRQFSPEHRQYGSAFSPVVRFDAYDDDLEGVAVLGEDGDSEFDNDPLNQGFRQDGTRLAGYMSPLKSSVMVGPTQPTNHIVLFEVFEDTTTPVKLIPKENVTIRRMVGSTASHASRFALRVFNVSRTKDQDIRKTRTISSHQPRVSNAPGTCKFSFVGEGTRIFNQQKENGEDDRVKPTLVGVVTLDLESFKNPFKRDGDVLQLDPIFVLPSAQHVTLLMPSEVSSFMELDHFVVEVFVNDDMEAKIMSLAIHKHVFFYLLFRSVATIPINDVQITPQGDTCNIVLHVRRIRKRGGKVYVAIEAIDFVVQDGFEKIRFVDTPKNKERRRTIFDMSTRTPKKQKEDDDDGFIESAIIYAQPCTREK